MIVLPIFRRKLDTYRRLLGVVSNAFFVVVSSLLPAVEYVLVYRFAQGDLLTVAIVRWAVAGAVAIAGALGHLTGWPWLLAAHATGGAAAVGALAGWHSSYIAALETACGRFLEGIGSLTTASVSLDGSESLLGSLAPPPPDAAFGPTAAPAVDVDGSASEVCRKLNEHRAFIPTVADPGVLLLAAAPALGLSLLSLVRIECSRASGDADDRAIARALLAAAESVEEGGAGNLAGLAGVGAGAGAGRAVGARGGPNGPPGPPPPGTVFPSSVALWPGGSPPGAVASWMAAASAYARAGGEGEGARAARALRAVVRSALGLGPIAPPVGGGARDPAGELAAKLGRQHPGNATRVAPDGTRSRDLGGGGGVLHDLEGGRGGVGAHHGARPTSSGAAPGARPTSSGARSSTGTDSTGSPSLIGSRVTGVGSRPVSSPGAGGHPQTPQSALAAQGFAFSSPGGQAAGRPQSPAMFPPHGGGTRGINPRRVAEVAPPPGTANLARGRAAGSRDTVGDPMADRLKAVVGARKGASPPAGGGGWGRPKK